MSVERTVDSVMDRRGDCPSAAWTSTVDAADHSGACFLVGGGAPWRLASTDSGGHRAGGGVVCDASHVGSD